MKTKTIWMAALCAASLGATFVSTGCQEEASSGSQVAAADKAASQKAATDKTAADKAAADKAAADKAAADKAAAAKAAADKAALDKAAADKAAADKAAASKAAADKAAADKAAADKAAAAKAATLAKEEAGALPPDMVEMKAEITRMTAQIDLTMAKLERLVTATGDLDKPSDEAIEAIEALEKEAKVLQQRSEQMRDRGAAYFEKWEKELASMTTPEVEAIAVKRKDELSKQYAEVLSAMQESRAAMDAFWGDILALRKHIEKGVTSDAQKVMAPQVQAAKEKATTLKDRIDATFTQLSQVSLIYTSK